MVLEQISLTNSTRGLLEKVMAHRDGQKRPSMHLFNFEETNLISALLRLCLLPLSARQLVVRVSLSAESVLRVHQMGGIMGHEIFH